MGNAPTPKPDESLFSATMRIELPHEVMQEDEAGRKAGGKKIIRIPRAGARTLTGTPDFQALLQNIVALRRRLGKALQDTLQQARHRLELARSSYVFRRPGELVRSRRQQADELRMRLEDAAREIGPHFRRADVLC